MLSLSKTRTRRTCYLDIDRSLYSIAACWKLGRWNFPRQDIAWTILFGHRPFSFWNRSFLKHRFGIPLTANSQFRPCYPYIVAVLRSRCISTSFNFSLANNSRPNTCYLEIDRPRVSTAAYSNKNRLFFDVNMRIISHADLEIKRSLQPQLFKTSFFLFDTYQHMHAI